MTVLVLATGLHAAVVDGADQPVGDASAVVETDPVLHSGDAADDMAIWHHPTDPSRSVVIGNDKGGALEVYDLTGARIQRIAEGFFGNVDLRQAVETGTGPADLIAVARRGVRIYGIDPDTRALTNVTDTATGSISLPFGIEGLCMYHSPATGSLYAYGVSNDGRVGQLELTDDDGDGLIEGRLVRSWDVGTEAEGCVADDELGHFYISEEDVGIWKYGAEPGDPTTPGARALVDSVVATGGHILPDAEGLTIVYQADGTGYLIASSQAGSDTLNSYLVYERQGDNTFIRSYRVVGGPFADGCGRTDGIDALAADLGPGFPRGVFVCQDNTNTAPAPGNQNFKLVPLELVVGLDGSGPANHPPVAVAGVSCDQLTCTATSAGSYDTDGEIVAVEWDFGDGTVVGGPSASHTYEVPGEYDITLTVTDDDMATGSTVRRITATDGSVAIEFVAAATSNANLRFHRVVVPTSVADGDGLLLFLSSNTLRAISPPTGSGWRLLDSLTASSGITQVWRKVATDADAGSTVTVQVASYAKVGLAVVAYRGTAVDDPVAAFAAEVEPQGTIRHTTPVVDVVADGSWVLSYWAHKDSTTTELVAPAEVVERASGTQTGGGRVTTLVADGGGPAPLGPAGGLTATAAATSNTATAWTIVLAP